MTVRGITCGVTERISLKLLNFSLLGNDANDDDDDGRSLSTSSDSIASSFLKYKTFCYDLKARWSQDSTYIIAYWLSKLKIHLLKE